MRNEADGASARRAFLVLWAALCLAKVLVAARLPLFVDEAFYWQEGQHLAAAYSDLPGLTAWLARLGVAIGGNHALALRMPFLVLGALVPWQVVAIGQVLWQRDATASPRWPWQAGMLALLLPLSGLLGVMALPDVALAAATLLCVHALLRLLGAVTASATLELAAGLALGALAHYRFIAAIGVGLLALLALPVGRRLLRDVRVWVAIAVGAAAWAPLVAWNLDNAEAGLRFQLVERHPWAFHGDGLWFLVVQAVLVTPLLLAALAQGAWQGARQREARLRLVALLGGGLVLGFFALGFFADVERVSFHWPLPGYLALLPLAPWRLAQWRRPWHRLAWALVAAALVVGLAGHAVVSSAALRARSAAAKWYPSNFSGWGTLATAVRELRGHMPPGTRIVADNFKVGAELGFALDDPGIAVLPHPLNRKHGRAPQLVLWRLRRETRAALGPGPLLLVLSPSQVEFKHLLAYYHEVCTRLGPLPAPRTVAVDHGRQRFLLFALPARSGDADAPCIAPAMAWIDLPAPGARVGRVFDVQGWAFKDGVGIERVEVLLDGVQVATADYGLAQPGVAAFWKISSDPRQPEVGFSARVRAGSVAPGRHWLGLRLVGRDGSVETWPEQPLQIVD